MCFSAIPGQNAGIRAIREFVSVRLVDQPKPAVQQPSGEIIFLRPVTTPTYSGRRQSMSHDMISWGGSRRNNRFDRQRGKAARKRQHKPTWRSYDKF